MSSVSPETMRVCFSSRLYSGVISRGDSMSSPDLIIWSNSAAVAIVNHSPPSSQPRIPDFQGRCLSRVESVFLRRQPVVPGRARGGYSSAWESTRLWIWLSRVRFPLATFSVHQIRRLAKPQAESAIMTTDRSGYRIGMSSRDFYDQLATDYHLVHQDWEAVIERQADALDRLIRSAYPQAKEILDCSCGIGTQAIGLARRGYRVHGTDVSER